MGMTDVAFFAATTASVPAVTITSTFSRTNSVAISGRSRSRMADFGARPGTKEAALDRPVEHWL
jgi:hypothetical protein